MRRLAGFFALGVAAFGLVTWLALEGGDVAALRTRAPDGAWRTTRVWWAENGGALWLEAATPERAWLADVAADARVELERDGRAAPFRAVAVPGDAAHDRIRRLLRAKYGWADAWVGLLQDTSRSIAVRLDALDHAREAPPATEDRAAGELNDRE